MQTTSKQKQVNTITLKTRAPGIEPTQPRSKVRILGRWAAHGDATITARPFFPSAVVIRGESVASHPLRASALACCRKNGKHEKRFPATGGNHKNNDGNHKKAFPATTETIKTTTETINKNVG